MDYETLSDDEVRTEVREGSGWAEAEVEDADSTDVDADDTDVDADDADPDADTADPS